MTVRPPPPRLDYQPTAEDLVAVLDISPSFYQAALDPGLWPGVLQRIADVFDAEAAQLSIADASTLELITTHVVGVEPEPLRRWAEIEDMRAVDSRSATYDLPNRVLREIDVISVETWHASRMFKDYMEPAGFDFAMAYLAVSDDTITSFGVMRALGKPPFSDDAVERMNLFIPHFRQALAVAGAVRGHSEIATVLSGMFDRLRTPVLVTDKLGRPIFINRAADGLVRRRRGLAIEDGRAITTDPTAFNDFRDKILDAALAGPLKERKSKNGIVPITDTKSGDQLIAVVSPAGVQDAAVAAATIFIIDPAQKLETDTETLQRLFGLTEREAAVMASVGTTTTLRDLGAALGVSHDTVKSHLKSVYSKIGVSTQAELVGLRTKIFVQATP